MPQDKTEIENSKIASNTSFSRESNLKTCFLLFLFLLVKIKCCILENRWQCVFDIYQFKANSIKKYRDPCVTLPSYAKV